MKSLFTECETGPSGEMEKAEIQHANDNDRLPATRSEAKSIGSKWYFTGKPCPHGHIAPRMTTNAACRTCAYERTANYLAERWNTNEEWRVEKVRQERERRRKPEVRAVEREKGSRRARERRTDPEIAEEGRRKCRVYYAEVRKHDPRYRELKVVYGRTRRARKAGSSGSHTLDDINEILKSQKYRCAGCGASVRKKKDRHVDHVMPLALGGSNAKFNLQVLCVKCNLSKGAKHPNDWARLNGRLV